MTDRLVAQFAFLNEADKLKRVLRATTLNDGSRPENSAEHSWHLTLYAMVLADQAAVDVDINRVIRMLILHDLVEIDVGDVPIHSANGTAHASQATQIAEQTAATRIFGLLPPDLGLQFRALWDEFEAAETPDAIFAKSLDRVQPVMANLMSGGGTWTEYNVTVATAAAGVASHGAVLAQPVCVVSTAVLPLLAIRLPQHVFRRSSRLKLKASPQRREQQQQLAFSSCRPLSPRRRRLRPPLRDPRTRGTHRRRSQRLP